MKFKGEKFKKDILKIKALPKGSKRRALVIAIAKKYDISENQVYLEAKKKPSLIGVRAERSDAGDSRTIIKKSELQMLEELLQQNKTQAEAAELIEKHFNIKISSRKLNKMVNQLKTKKLKDDSAFGSEVKKLIEKAVKLDMIGINKTIKIKFEYDGKALEVPLNKQDIEHILMVMAARYNMAQYAESKKLRVDDNRLLRSQLKYIVAEEIQKAQSTGSLESLDKLSLIQGRLDDSVGTITPSFELILILIQNEYKNSTTPEELVSLLEKYKEQMK